MSLEHALHFLEEENKKFEGHWIWKRLGCRPHVFFQAFQRHLSTLQVPRDKWEKALRQAKDASRIRVKERFSKTRTTEGNGMAGLKV